MSNGRLQQVDIPLKKEVNKHEEDFSNFKEEDLGIQVSEEEVVETPPKEVEDNKHSLLEEEEAVTITVTRGISSVIIAINLGTITLNVKVRYTNSLYSIGEIHQNHYQYHHQHPHQKDQEG
jgi:hypothetical protein